MLSLSATIPIVLLFLSRGSFTHRKRQLLPCRPASYQSNDLPAKEDLPATSLLLHVSYDGGRFNGWSASNDGGTGKGFVRSVQGVLRQRFAKLFGNIDESRIVLEGTSRTDKGVHAKTMIAQVYCLAEDWESSDAPLSIPGKRFPHPRSMVDNECFVPFSKQPSNLLFVLNRMLPHDISIRRIGGSPSQEGRPFHPTLDAVNKTYEYTISIGKGHLHDPTQLRRTWHSGGSSFDMKVVQLACNLLEGEHDFRSFRGAPRGKTDIKRFQTQNTVCTMSSVSIKEIISSPLDGLKVFRVSITGDRFLYKMVRLLIGALVDVGQGKLGISDLDEALQTGTWGTTLKPECAPANGLVLVDAEFNSEINWLAK